MGSLSTIAAKRALKWHWTRILSTVLVLSGAWFSTAVAAPFPPLIPQQYGFTEFGGWETSIAANQAYPCETIAVWLRGGRCATTADGGASWIDATFAPDSLDPTVLLILRDTYSGLPRWRINLR
jgi:hypothetical protein